MKTIPLYRYIRISGGITVTPEKPNTEYTELTRLAADDGYILTDGTNFTACIDTDNPDIWVEVVDGEKPDEPTAADYQASLAEFGVKL